MLDLHHKARRTQRLVVGDNRLVDDIEGAGHILAEALAGDIPAEALAGDIPAEALAGHILEDILAEEDNLPRPDIDKRQLQGKGWAP